MFIAVDLSSSVRARAEDLIRRLQEVGAGVRWIDTPRMHITLKFLGDVEDGDVMTVCGAVKEIAAGTAPFAIHCGGAGAFPDIDRPRTLWLGVKEGGDELAELHERIDVRMHEIGYAREPRRYHPHLTIGRVARGAGDLSELSERVSKYSEIDGGLASIDELVVYASYLERRGPTYDAMSRCSLLG
jgi:2'-5' RNA ligase